MKKIILTLLLFSIYLFSNAQSNFKKGSIIKLNGTEVQGSINYTGDIQNSKVCVFKNEHGNVTRYHPGEISGYRYNRGGYYVSRYLKDTNTVHQIFARYLVRGEKSVYFLRDKSGYHYLLEFKKDTLTLIPYEVNIIWKKGNPYEQTPTAYKGYLQYYFKDQPSLKNTISQMGQPSFNNMIRLTKKYNELTCGDTCYTVYYKQPSLKFGIEPRYDFYLGKNLLYDQGILSSFGVLVYLRLPRAGERWSIKTGYFRLFYKKNETQTVEQGARIPLMVNYIFTNNRTIQPKIDIGVNIISSLVVVYNISPGVMVQIDKKLFLDLGYETFIHPGAMIGGTFFMANSLHAGFYLKL